MMIMLRMGLELNSFISNHPISDLSYLEVNPIHYKLVLNDIHTSLHCLDNKDVPLFISSCHSIQSSNRCSLKF